MHLRASCAISHCMSSLRRKRGIAGPERGRKGRRGAQGAFCVQKASLAAAKTVDNAGKSVTRSLEAE